MRMKPIIFTCFFILIIIFQGRSQMTFHKSYEYPFELLGMGDMIVTNDNGYIITGRIGTSSSSTDIRFIVIKTGGDGNVNWGKIYTDTAGASIHISKILQTNDNGYVIAGGGQVAPSDPNFDGFAIKTDSLGNILWNFRYGGNARESFWNVNENTNGDLVFWGNSEGDCYIVKTNSSGIVLQSKTFGKSNEYFTSPYSFNALTSDGGYIYAVSADLPGGAINGDKIIIIKIDSIFNEQWARELDLGINSGPTDREELTTIKQTSDGGYLLGAIKGSNPYFGHIIKLDSTGKIDWANRYNSTNPYQSVIPFDFEEKNGGYIILGNYYGSTFGYPAFIAQSDLSGNIQWVNRYSIYGCERLEITNNDEFVLGGIISGFSGFAIMKMDSNADLGCSQSTSAFTLQNDTFQTINVSLTSSNLNSSTNYNLTAINYIFGDSTICSNTSVVETATSKFYDISIVPNPSNGKFTVHHQEKNQILSLEIFNLEGETILQQQNTKEINMLSQPKGIYFLKLQTKEKAYYKKLIFQ